MRFLKPLMVALIILLSLVLILYPNGNVLLVGMLIAFLAAFVHASLSQEEDARARWIFIAIFIFLAGLFGWLIHSWLAANAQPDGYTGELGLRVLSFGLGVVAAIVPTLFFFVITVYVSAVYVLSLPQVEGVTTWQAFRSLLSLILKINYDWIVISEGKIAKVKEKGVMKELGGPGKVIVDPGNAVVLQRGGKITQVRGAGVWMTQRNENIREIFDLTNQFTVTTVDRVLTADQIPLSVDMGIGYRIVRESDPNTDGLIETRDDSGGFLVREETLRRAIFNNTTGGKWSGFGGAAPTVQLRDHFMTFTLNELFELTSENGDTPRPNRRRINQIEQQILDGLNGFAGNLGVTITAVDIRSIKLPDKMVEGMAESAAIQLISRQRNEANQEQINDILETIARFTGRPIGVVELQLATEFIRMSRRGLTDDILGHEYIQMLRELAKSDGPKIFTPPNMGMELKDIV